MSVVEEKISKKVDSSCLSLADFYDIPDKDIMGRARGYV